MKQMRASTFKARCLTIMNDVQATGEPVIVTKRGTPVVKVVPVESNKSDLFGFMAGEFKNVCEIEAPLFPQQFFSKGLPPLPSTGFLPPKYFPPPGHPPIRATPPPQGIPLVNQRHE